jgi:hypothetical protein
LRRIISILLLGLLLYNMTGYSIAFLLEQRDSIKASTDFIEKSAFSRDIVIKVPASIPYQTNWEVPEEVEGKIEHEGQFYNMVTRQLINDTLYVYCEFDQNARDQFTELVSKINDQVSSDNEDPDQKGSSKILKNFLHEYMSGNRNHVFYILEWVAENTFVPQEHFVLTPYHLSIPSPPPNIV